MEQIISWDKFIEVAKEFIGVNAIKDSVNHVVSKLYGNYKDSSKLNTSLKKYYKNVLVKYSYSKTLLNNKNLVFLYSFYVNLELSLITQGIGCKNVRTINTETFNNVINEGKSLIITGSAGSGKTTLLKHLFITAISKGKGKYIPLFIELKNIEKYEEKFKAKDYGLKDFFVEFLNSQGLDITKDILMEMIKNENIILFLDGYDEVKFSMRKNIISDLNKLDIHEKLNIIVTSRPSNEGFNSWSRFTELEVKQLTKEKAMELVNKLDIWGTDEFQKERFLKELENEKLVKNEFFLSNPLLLNILILTYSCYPKIPDKSYLFYEGAYDALYIRHDSLKELYNRTFYTQLDSHQFKTILSTLSAISYFNDKIVFKDYRDLKGNLDNVSKIIDIKFNKEDYIKDLVESVSILIREDTEYTFIHRSFQEYFTAMFLLETTKIEDSVKMSIIKEIPISQENKVFDFMFEKDEEYTRQLFVNPLIDEIKDNIEFNKGNVNESKRLFFLKYGERMDFSLLKNENNINLKITMESTKNSCVPYINLIYEQYRQKYKKELPDRKKMSFNEKMKVKDEKEKLIETISTLYDIDPDYQKSFSKMYIGETAYFNVNIDIAFNNIEIANKLSIIYDDIFSPLPRIFDLMEKLNKKDKHKRNLLLDQFKIDTTI